MRETDLLILGAGPAGLSAALHLLQLDPGWAGRVLVLEKAAHPRPKLCGGGVTRLGLDILAGLGLPTPLPLPHAPVHEVQLVYGRRAIPVRGNPAFVVYDRQEFDAYLAAQARARGAVLHENEPVQSILAEREGVVVTTSRGEYRARAVIGADGSKGPTRRIVEAARPVARPSPVARLLEVIAPAPAGAALFTKRQALFDFTPTQNALQGYTWDFPARVAGAPHFNRGIFDGRVAPARPKADLPALLTHFLEALPPPTGPAPVQGHPIHWFSPRNRLARPRVLLVGDAAGAEPLLGEGIGPALAYGPLAARAVAYAFETGDFSFADYTRRVIFSELGAYLLLRWYIAWWGYRLSGQPWYMHLVWTIGQGLAVLTNPLRER